MMPAYAKALLCVYAKAMRETIDEVAKSETDPITAHKLAEVKAECEWCERNYGGGEMRSKEEIESAFKRLEIEKYEYEECEKSVRRTNESRLEEAV